MLNKLDLDEFVQPLGTFSFVKQVLDKYDNVSQVAALQLRNRFWDHHPVLEANFSKESYEIWNMLWRDKR